MKDFPPVLCVVKIGTEIRCMTFLANPRCVLSVRSLLVQEVLKTGAVAVFALHIRQFWRGVEGDESARFTVAQRMTNYALWIELLPCALEALHSVCVPATSPRGCCLVMAFITAL